MAAFRKVLFGLIGLLILASSFRLTERRNAANKEHLRLQVTEAPVVSAVVRSLRPNYPYSIIPGGAYSREDLRDRARADEVVQAHYAGFDLKNTRVVALTEPHLAYVSFRIKDRVLWTKRKLMVPKGELLLTDGHKFARCRCGNQLSETLPPEVLTSDFPYPELSLPPFSFPMWRQGLVDSYSPPATGRPVLPADWHGPETPVLAFSPGGPTPIGALPIPPEYTGLRPNTFGGILAPGFPGYGVVATGNTKTPTTPTGTTPGGTVIPPVVIPPIVNVVPEPHWLPEAGCILVLLLAGRRLRKKPTARASLN